MLDNIALINRIMAEHQAIRAHVKLAGDTVSDQEALSSLERGHADWVSERPQTLPEKQSGLQQTISFLDEGLKNHFALEENGLPPLLGVLLMRALMLDHREIEKEIGEAKSLMTESRLEGLRLEEFLDKELHIRRIIGNISRLVEEHATKEEVVLEMLGRALEDKPENRS